MRIPINMGVKGRVTATLTNTETGEKQEVKGDNLILNHYLDWAMERGLGILGSTTFNRCYIGTSNVPPQPTDTTFVGTQLAMSASSALVKDMVPTLKIEQVNLNQGVGVSDYNSLAVTPDENILIVGINGDTVDLPGLRAFLIDKNNWTLTPLQVNAFADLENLNCRALSTGGNYLFVGLEVAPWGKLFRRNGNNFEFVANTPELLGSVLDSDIFPGGNYLIVCSSNKVVLYKIIDNSISELLTTTPSNVNAVGFSPSGERYFVASGPSSGGSGGNGYLHIYKQEGQTYSLEFTYSQTGSYGRVNSADFVSDNSLVVLDGVGYTTDYTLRRLDYNMDTGNWDEISSVSSGVRGDKVDCLAGKYILLSGSRAIWVPPVALVYTNTDESPTLYKSTALLNNAGVFFTRVSGSGYSGIGVYRIRPNLQNTQSYSRQWTFPAGVGTGTVNRVGLQANSGTGENGNSRHVAQIVLPEPLGKTDLHQLDVIWEIEVENPGVWEGIILGGSRDGSDLDWRITINEEQFYDLVQTGYRIPANWFGVTGTPNVRIGTSNEESDLMFDRANIRGRQIQYISSTALRVVNPYVSGSLKRTIRVFLEVNQGNGQIGEIVLGGSTSANSLARITFDPPLDKPPHEGEGANPYRIYLDLEIGWQRGENDA
jgi:hypothetical protein